MSSAASIQNRDTLHASFIRRASASSTRLERSARRSVKPLIIGIAGGTGSGKSTVARKVAEALEDASVAFIEMDAYYRNFAHLSMDERRQIN